MFLRNLSLLIILMKQLVCLNVSLKSFFETFLQFICDSLKEKQDVKIVNFGIFKIRRKKARVGRNPKTKVEVTISPRNVITFKASEYLNGLINSNSNNDNLNERN